MDKIMNKKFFRASSFFVLLMVTACGNTRQPDRSITTKLMVNDGEVVSSSAAQATQEKDNSPCPNDMVWVHGNYCPKTDETCLYYVTSYGKRTKEMTDRCGEFKKPVHCLVPTKYKSYCMDRFEFPNKQGVIPRDWLSFNIAEKLAKQEGKRLCTNSEWTFAATGEENFPLPYGDGFHRTHECNIDRHASEVGLTGDHILKNADPNSEVSNKLRTLLVPSGSMPNCISSMGVADMAGNLDEVLINESGRPYKSTLMSGFYLGVRNRSRAQTTAHSPSFQFYEVGTRFCSDVKKN
jgi:formylglycine-generating enzyme